MEGSLADGVELEADGDDLITDLPPSAGDQWLVVTGLSRNTITTAIPVEIAPAPPPDSTGGCCSTGQGDGPGATFLVGLVALVGFRRRAAKPAA